MTEDTALDTRICEPGMTAGEIEMLLFALQRSRAQFAWKCGGKLGAAGLNQAHPPSAMTLGGLLKHSTWLSTKTGSPPSGSLMGRSHRRGGLAISRPIPSGTGWHSAADDFPEELYALWRGAVERLDGALAAMLADGGADQPTKFTISTGESPNLRGMLVDLHDEYARHVGHADLFRESVDGLVGEDPPQP